MYMGDGRPLIDTGQAIEIYCDGLGSIEIHGTTVCFNGFRLKGGDKIINLTVIVPIGAIPDIASQIAITFSEFITRRVKEKLLIVAH